MKHLAKEEMEDGQYYVGWCRNTHVAEWDAKKDTFVHIRYKFGLHIIDTLPHFDDVKEIRTDGFIPFEKINHPKLDKDIRKYVHEIGY